MSAFSSVPKYSRETLGPEVVIVYSQHTADSHLATPQAEPLAQKLNGIISSRSFLNRNNSIGKQDIANTQSLRAVHLGTLRGSAGLVK